VNDILAVAIGVALGVLASVPVAMVIAAPYRSRPQRAERSTDAQRVEAELVTDERLAIPKDDYVASVQALGDKMASLDPYTRQLAALAYDAFKDAVKPL